jgi:hypothetical protein
VSYFNAQSARKPGFRTTSHGWASIYPVSQKAGRIKTARVPIAVCLNRGVHPTGVCPSRVEPIERSRLNRSFPFFPFSLGHSFGAIPAPCGTAVLCFG